MAVDFVFRFGLRGLLQCLDVHSYYR